MNKLFKLFFFVIICISLCSSFAFAQTESPSKPKEEQKYIPESIRARLPEARACTKERPGTNWTECRYNCADVCNEIIETYVRGVCNGVLIQICCGIHPSTCK